MALVKMSRVYIVGPSDHKEETMRFLQEAGVVHVEPVTDMTDEFDRKNAAAVQDLRKITQVSKAVRRHSKQEEKTPVPVPDEELVTYIEKKVSLLEEIRSRKQALQRVIEDLSVWGDFDLQQIRKLEENGVYVQRFRMDEKKWSSFSIPDDVFLETVSEKQGIFFFTISADKPLQISQATLLSWPDLGLDDAKQEYERLLKQEDKLTKELAGAADKTDTLQDQYRAALSRASYIEKTGTVYSEDYLFGVQGWIPCEQEDELLKEVEKSSLPLQVSVRDPLPEEVPPSLLKNNWFIKRIEPLLNLYGVPNYREIDPSYFFAPFMILFFGVCLSDAGYGLVFFLVSYWADKKFGSKIQGLSLVMKLCQAFSVATIFVGLVTGSIFGYNFINREWIPIDLSVGTGDPMILFYISLGLGVLHLSFSYILGIIQAPSLRVQLEKLGVMGVLWGGVILVSRNIWFSGPASIIHLPLFYGGVGILAMGLILTLLFATDNKNWGIRIGLGLWNIYGMTGLIGDLLSYARLFGLGIATGAIASVMNQLGGMVMGAGGKYAGPVLAVMVIIIGHIFNLALSILGSTVHSARLHFVEAFKSFFQGGGIEYKPFKIERG
ncbi:MAG: V-type ATP synthase subunit I [Pseudomonadota bacterium]